MASVRIIAEEFFAKLEKKGGEKVRGREVYFFGQWQFHQKLCKEDKRQVDISPRLKKGPLSSVEFEKIYYKNLSTIFFAQEDFENFK